MARRGHTLLLLGGVITGGAVLLFDGHFPAETATSVASVLFGFPLLAVGLTCLVASALSTNGWLRLRIPGAQTCATLAYCLYLTQKQMLHLTDAWFPGLGRLPWLVAYLAVCVSVAAVLHLCVERPFLRLRERSRGVAGVPATAIAAD
jgi:peptidoglycan/LPS O-acetylase OafA/YrhL